MILHLYLARRFLWTFLAIVMIFVILLALIELIDDLRAFSALSFGDVVEIGLLKIPEANYEILPLVIILASVAMFLRMSRSSELVVVRAAGRSALRALIAPLIVALLIGIVSVSMLNPIVAASAKRHNDLVNSYLGWGPAVMAISPEGIWLRQGNEDGQTVIHARRASSDVSVLFNTTFIAFSHDGEPLQRIMADKARLGDGAWHLSKVKLWDLELGVNAEANAEVLDSYDVPSSLTRDRIIDSFGKPEYISIWELPDFIAQLEQSGFSARCYGVWFQMELARPLFLLALVMMSAAFTMRHARLHNTGMSVLTAVMLGFGLHYIRNFAQILGDNGQIPVMLAAWAPPVASFLLALGILLHMEEG